MPASTWSSCPSESADPCIETTRVACSLTLSRRSGAVLQIPRCSSTEVSRKLRGRPLSGADSGPQVEARPSDVVLLGAEGDLLSRVRMRKALIPRPGRAVPTARSVRAGLSPAPRRPRAGSASPEPSAAAATVAADAGLLSLPGVPALHTNARFPNRSTVAANPWACQGYRRSIGRWPRRGSGRWASHAACGESPAAQPLLPAKAATQAKIGPSCANRLISATRECR